MIDGRLRIEPHLPSEWSSLEFGIDYQGEGLTIKVDKATLRVSKADNGKALHFDFQGSEQVLHDSLTLALSPQISQ